MILKAPQFIISKILLFLLICTLSSTASASFMVRCIVQGQILKIESKEVQDQTDPSGVQLTFHALASLTLPGSHADACTDLVQIGIGYPIFLQAPQDQVNTLKRGEYLNVRYEYISSEGGDEVEWILYSLFQPTKSDLKMYQQSALSKEKAVEKLTPLFKSVDSKTPYSIHIHIKNSPLKHTVECEEDECKGNESLFLNYRQEEHQIELSMKSKTIQKKTLKALKEGFEGATLSTLLIPNIERTLYGWRVEGNQLQDLEFTRNDLGSKIKLIEYTAGRLKGEMMAKVQTFSAMNFRIPCAPLPYQKLPSKECLIQNQKPVWIKILFDLPL